MGTKTGDKKKIILVASAVSVLLILGVIIFSGALQQKLTLNSKVINSKVSLDEIANSSATGIETDGGIVTTVNGGGSSGGGSSGGGGGGSGGGSSASALSGEVILAAGDPSFSNYWDNSGMLIGSGIARFNVSIAGSNGSDGISIGGKNYSIDNNNWLDFDGVGDYVDYGNNAQFSPGVTGDISLAVIATPSTTSQTMSAISKYGGTAGTSEYELVFDNAGNIVFNVYSPWNKIHCAAAIGPTAGDDYPYVAGRSYFIYAEYINSTSCSLQINQGDIRGAVASNVYTYTAPTGQGPANLQLGQRNYATAPQDFNGSIDNFEFYNKILNPIQINRLYNEWVMGKSVPVLSYHQIVSGAASAQEMINKNTFATQMAFLNASGYKTITYQQWANWTNGIGTIPAKPIIIDFDDDWYTVYFNARPIMNQYGYVGVVAVPVFYEELSNGGISEQDTMNWGQLATLANSGWEIASHSYTHANMTNIPSQQQIIEFNSSRVALQGNLSKKVSTFIYPFDEYNVATDTECGKYYEICSGYSSYPEHADQPIGDIDFFIFKNTNKIFTNGAPLGMRRVTIINSTTLNDFEYYINYNGQQINSPFDYSDSGNTAYDISGHGNNGAITGAAWNNNNYYTSILLNPGVYSYYWWAYDGLGGYDPSDIRSYIVYPPYVPNISLQITSPTTTNPINASSGSDVSIYFNFLNSSYTGGQWFPKNVTSGIVINNVIIGGKLATILPSPSVKTSHTYGASTIFTKSTESINQPPEWYDAWDGSNASSSCYNGMLTQDGSYCTISVSGYYPSKEPWARINFTVPEDVNTITSLQVTATARSSSSSSSKKVAFILANFGTGNWVEFEARTNSEVTRTVTFTSGISNYIQNGQLVMLIEGANMISGDSIGINYASIVVNSTSSSGSQFLYVPGRGWQVNVTAPNATDGLQNLFVNATWASYYGYAGSDTQINAIDYRTDKINPDIQIVYPLNNTNTTNTNLDVNYTVSDANLVGCWYTNNNISINNSIACGQNITAVIWSEGQHNVTVWAKDLSNNVNSSSVRFRIDTTPPSFINLTNQNLYDNQSLNYDINATDSGIGFGSFAINWTTIFGIVPATGVLTNISNLTAGLYYINVSINDTIGNLNSTILLINVSSAADKVPPYFTAIPAAANINYAQGFGVDFNASDERVFGTYAINQTTLFMINASGWLTNSSPSIATGNYYINVTINDTANNLNSTIYFVNVSKAITILNLTAISPITYPTSTNFTGTGCPSQLNCSLDKANGVYGTGNVTFNYSTVGNANYTPASAVFTVTISQNSSYVLGINGTTPITYGISTDVAGSGCPLQLNCSLNKANAVYGVGTVTFNYSSAGNANYTSRSVAKDIVINKATLNFAVTLTSPINYLTPSNYIGRITNGEASCSPILYRTAVHLGTGAVSIGNGFAINDTTVLGVGTYMYNYSARGCVNYTDSENIKTLFVNLVGCYSNAECNDSNPHTQDICNNPGTPQSSCSHSAIACLSNSECDDSNPRTQDICNNPGTNISSCSNLAIACLSDSECGTNAYLNSPLCQSENVWQNFKTYTCNNAGTSTSSCSDSTSLQLKETCAGGCIEGRCKTKVCENVCNYGTCYEYCVWQ